MKLHHAPFRPTAFRSLLTVMAMLSVFTLSNFKPIPPDQQGIDTNYYYRLTTQWLGDGKALDVVNDGANNKIHLTQAANVTGQYWRFIPLGNGYYKMTTQWLGEGKALDVINDGKNNRLHMTNSANYSGQSWKITSMGNGFFRLTTQWQGDGKSLDVINDGRNNQLQLAPTGSYSGQFWKLTALAPVQQQPAVQQPVGSLDWVAYNGSIPSNAVNGGYENGRNLPVCRTNYNGAMHPGKVVANMCNIGWGGKEITARSFEVLVNNGGAATSWVSVSGQIPGNAVQAGTENGKPLYVGQATMSNGSVHPGKVFGTPGAYICNYGYGGSEIVEKSNFKVLVKN